jgi:cytochrome c2
MRTRWVIAAAPLAAVLLLTGCNMLMYGAATLHGSDTVTATPEPAGIDAAALVETRCTVCHTRERIDNKAAGGAVRAAWVVTIDKMIYYGAQLNADEREALIEYLTAQSRAQKHP